MKLVGSTHVLVSHEILKMYYIELNNFDCRDHCFDYYIIKLKEMYLFYSN